jgi:hypothetical protein
MARLSRTTDARNAITYRSKLGSALSASALYSTHKILELGFETWLAQHVLKMLERAKAEKETIYNGLARFTAPLRFRKL